MRPGILTGTTLVDRLRDILFLPLSLSRVPFSYLRLIDSCITQRKAQGPSRTCNERKEEEVPFWLRLSDLRPEMCVMRGCRDNAGRQASRPSFFISFPLSLSRDYRSGCDLVTYDLMRGCRDNTGRQASRHNRLGPGLPLPHSRLSSDDVFQEISARYRAVGPEQWLQRHPEAGSSWPGLRPHIEQRANNLNGVKHFCAENGSSQGRNLAVSFLCVPNSAGGQPLQFSQTPSSRT